MANKKSKSFLVKKFNKKIFFLLFILLALPLTVWLAINQTNLFNHASGNNPCRTTIGGHYVKYWFCPGELGEKLYYCNGRGEIVKSKSCPIGCHINNSGQEDSCRVWAKNYDTDPCNVIVNGGYPYGYFCPKTGDVHLLKCRNSKTIDTVYCHKGCRINSGKQDSCR